MTYQILLAVALFGILGDVLTTLYVLHVQGGRELNGAMGWLMSHIGIAPALWMTHGFIAAICLWAYHTLYMNIVILFAVLFLGVTLWNLYQIIRG